MRIAVIGAGGVGGYYGARWQEAGHHVTFVARGEHLAALREEGLRVDHTDFHFHGRVTALAMEEFCVGDPANYDLLALAIKSSGTAAVAASLADWFARCDVRVPVLSLQNGVDNEPMLGEALGVDCVLGGLAIRVGTHVESPGHITASGEGQLVVGLWPDETEADPGPASDVLPALVRACEEAGIPVTASPDIRRELWRKLVINNAVNPLSAVTGWDTGRLTHDAGMAAVVRRLMRETASVARADGVLLDDTDIEEMFELVYSLTPIRTSMLVDRLRGRPMELDALCGAVVERARRLGVDVPATETVAALAAGEIWSDTGPSGADN
jgi:2-dehydropantoate 2-reductase